MTSPNHDKKSRHGVLVDHDMSLIECDEQCKRDIMCEGYDYSPTTGQCYRDFQGDDFEYQPGMIHYKVKMCPQGKL